MMAYNNLLRTLAILVVFGCLNQASNSTLADDSKLLQMINTTDRNASCIQFRVFGTDGDLTINPAMVIGGPESPEVTISHQGNYASVKFDWGDRVITSGDAVTALLQTANGRLGFRSGYWCQDNIRLGRIELPSGLGPYRGPGGLFRALPALPSPGLTCKIVVQIRCVNFQAPIYTPWFKGPARIPGRSFCWWRWCCRQPYDWEYRLSFCCFRTSPLCVFDAETFCVPLTSWADGGTVRGKYNWQFTSIKPKDEPVIQKWNIFGPPKDVGRELANTIGTTYSRKVFVADSETGIFRATMDASAAYQAMATALIPTVAANTDLTRADTFQKILLLNGETYQQAARIAYRLVDSLREALHENPDSNFAPMGRRIHRIALNLNTVGVCFAAGRAPSASTVYELADAYDDLASEANRLGDLYGLHRFNAVARNYTQLANAMRLAGDQLRLGLPNVGSKDDFLWAMLVAHKNGLRDVGVSHEAHTRIKFGLTNHEWDSNNIPAALVSLRNTNGTLVDSFDVPVSDFNSIHLPFMGNVVRGHRYIATVKVVGTLAKSFVLSFENDGNSVRITELVQGDVDDDNCIDIRDLRLVVEDEGAGGQDAPFVPPTDVDANGIVTTDDAEIVFSNLGQCGDR